ncbi:MAG: RHS repeat-associated core domain-containing protein [Candidatus Gracilibacteria bacterium]
MSNSIRRLVHGFLTIIVLSNVIIPISPPALAEEIKANSDKIEQNTEETIYSASETGEDGVSNDDIDQAEGRLHPEIDDFTGAFIYDYNFQLPKGRGELQPSLTLSYNSQRNEWDSFYGAGWSIGIPSITRINKTGINNLHEETYFSSSISGELVNKTSSTYGDYASKVDPGTFIKYTFNSDESWTATDKSGTTYSFGATTDSRQDDIAEPTHIYQWMLEEIRDVNNNYIHYEYFKDSGQIYPKRITYTGSNSTDGIFTINFTLEDRTDTSTFFNTGFEVETNYRINKIATSIEDNEYRDYTLGYETPDDTKRSRLTSITESATNQSGETIALPTTSFGYGESEKDWTEVSGYNIPIVFHATDSYEGNGIEISDVNGDGFLDLLKSSGSGLVNGHVYVNSGDGTGWTEDASYHIPVHFWGSDNYMQNARMADLNGDSSDDIIYAMASNRAAYTFNEGPNTWIEDSAYSIPLSFNDGYLDDRGVLLVDINGDSFPDFVQSLRNSSQVISVYLFDPNTKTWNIVPTDVSIPVAFNDKGIELGDVNGDRLIDIVKSESIYQPQAVYLNQGDGTGWTEATGYNIPTYFWDRENMMDVANMIDVNGDGLSDIVYSGISSTANAVYINQGDGTGWIEDTAYTVPVKFAYEYRQPYGVRFFDVNGDNFTDAVLSHQSSGSSTKKVYINNVTSELLESITSSYGSTTTIEYAPSTEFNNPELPFVIDVVASTTVEDGLGTSSTATYSYEGGEYYYVDEFDRQFAGFSKITKTEDERVTNTYFEQDERAKIGHAYKTEVYDDAGNLYQIATDTWETYDLGYENEFVFKSQSAVMNYFGSSHVDTGVAYAYDDNGNLLTQTNYGEVDANEDGTFTDTGADLRETEMTYATDANGIIQNKPASKTLKDESDATVQETLYYYDSLPYGEVSTGNLTIQKSWISGTSYASSTFAYNSYGNVETLTDPLGNTTTYSYDSYNLYANSVENSLGQITDIETNLANGKPTRTVSANGAVTEADYDGFGRPIKERRTQQDGSLQTVSTLDYDDESIPHAITSHTYFADDLYAEKITYFDGLNRVIEEKTLNADGGYFESETLYDALGRVESKSLPATTVTEDLFEYYSYDPLNRPTQIENSIGTQTMEYDGFTVSSFDALGNQKDSTSDSYSNLIEVIEYLDGTAYTTEYEWTTQNQLSSITDTLGNERNFTFNGLGQRLSAEDLHAPSDSTFGTWHSTYDLAGNLETKLSPNGFTTTYTYDALNRILTEDSNFSEGVEATYTYDSCQNGEGFLCSTSTNNGTSTNYAYYQNGGLQSKTTVIAGTDYQTSYTYDYQGNPLTQTHPDGTTIRSTYNAIGKIETTEKKTPNDADFVFVVTDTNYGPNGQITEETYANGTTTSYTYDASNRYRLTNKTTTGYSAYASDPITTSFYTNSADGYVYKAHAVWDNAHDSTAGHNLNSTSASSMAGTSKSTTNYSIYRSFLPFDTSTLPDNTLITSAILKVYVSSKKDHDNDGDDFITVVQSSQDSSTALTAEDYNNAGTVDNPIEGIDSTERKDITNISTGAWLNFNLNTIGKNWISTTEATMLAFREGHDVLDSAFTNSSPINTQYNVISYYNSENTGTSYDPILEITYTAPVATTIQNLSYSYDDVGNITQIVDSSATESAKTTAYTYDDLYRLTSSTVSSAVSGSNETIDYSYNIIGNILSRSDLGTYSYDGDVETGSYANPHAVTSIVKTEGSTDSFTYNQNGTLASTYTANLDSTSETTSYTWDYADHMTSREKSQITSGATYDPVTVSFSTNTGDGYAYKASGLWDNSHDSVTGSANGTSASAMFGSTKSTTSYYIHRSFLPFDTSSLPDDAIVSSATLKVYATAKTNDDNDGDDFVTVVKSSQSSATTLAGSDYNKAGAINSPTEGIDSTSRKDITDILTNTWLNFDLNVAGKSWVSTTGATMFALREGHDVLDSAFTSSSSTTSQSNTVTYRNSEYTGTFYDPILEITYTLPSTYTEVPLGDSTYTYDQSGQRTSKSWTDSEGAVYQTIYPSTSYDIEGTEHNIYVGGPSGTDARIHYDGISYSTNSNHSDHLGSISVITDEDGAVSELLDYYPYGTERLHSGATAGSGAPDDSIAKTYIGEYSDDDSGLSYLNARYYDPARGQFLSEDPAQLDGRIMKILADPQSLNFYAYSRGNPVMFVDPNGEFWDTLWDVANLIYDSIWGTEEDMAFDAAMTMIPGIPAGATKVDDLVSGASKYSDEIAQYSEKIEIQITNLVSGSFPKGITVLGTTRGGYEEYAKSIGAYYFRMSDKAWANLNDSQRWAANQTFLDNAIARGDDIFLNDVVGKIDDATGFFGQELDYLTQNGYKLSEDGKQMIKE